MNTNTCVQNSHIINITLHALLKNIPLIWSNFLQFYEMKRCLSWFLVSVLCAYTSASADGDTNNLKSSAVTSTNVTNGKVDEMSAKTRVARALTHFEKNLYLEFQNSFRRKVKSSNMRELVGIPFIQLLSFASIEMYFSPI